MTREVTEAERLATVERDVRDHSSTLSAHNMAIETLDRESVERRIAAAAEGERNKALYGRLDRMDTSMEAIRKEVNDFKKAVTRPLWALAGIFGLALTGALIKMAFAGSALGAFLK